MDNFSIEANKLVRRTPVDHLIYRNDLIITKEEFLACYDAWVSNADNVNDNSSKLCPYCSEEQYLKYSKGAGIEIMNKNVLRAFGTDTEIVQPINFCPMCGKKLS
jgi:hypothetical protein